MSDIFMSYAREDESRVRDRALEFERLGWSVWYDRNIGTSAEFDEEIEREERPTEQALSLPAEISSATGKPPRGLESRVEGAERAGGRSGAKTVTAGKWRLTAKGLFSELPRSNPDCSLSGATQTGEKE